MVSPSKQGERRGKTEKVAIKHTINELERATDFFDLPEKQLMKADPSLLEKMPQRYLEECEGIAEGSGFPREKIFAINFSMGIFKLFKDGCTAFTVPKEHSESGASLLMKNRDLPYRRMFPQVLTYSDLDGYNRFLGVTNGGNASWYQGVNDKGLTIFNTATQGGKYEEGMIIPILIRSILEECEDTVEAIKFIKTNKIDGCSNLFLGDHNDVYIIELKNGYPPHVKKLKKPDARANHYLFHDNLPAITKTEIIGRQQTLTRYTRAKQLLKGLERVSVNNFIEFSKDHNQGPGPYSICRHEAFVGSTLDKILTSTTLSCQIFKIGEEIETFVSLGQPCQTEFKHLHFNDEIPSELASGERWLENLTENKIR